jgi:hypothetical protein
MHDWENNGYKSILILLGYPKAELVKTNLATIFLNNIIANKDAFKEKQEKSLHYENVQIETANGLEINVDFTLNTYITDSHVVIQCLFVTLLMHIRNLELIIIKQILLMVQY